jgi:hypothetical protein
VSDVLDLLHRARAAHRRETVRATVALLNDLLGRNREVRDIRIKPGAGAVMVTVGESAIRSAIPSAGQGLALRDLGSAARSPLPWALSSTTAGPCSASPESTKTSSSPPGSAVPPPDPERRRSPWPRRARVKL